MSTKPQHSLKGCSPAAREGSTTCAHFYLMVHVQAWGLTITQGKCGCSGLTRGHMLDMGGSTMGLGESPGGFSEVSFSGYFILAHSRLSISPMPFNINTDPEGV